MKPELNVMDTTAGPMALSGLGGVFPMSRAEAEALDMPAPKAENPLSAYAQLVGDFRAEKSASEQVRLERENIWRVNLANYNDEIIVPQSDNTTSEAIYPRYEEVISRYTSDLLRMMSPLAEYTFNVKVYKEDTDEVDYETGQKIRAKVKGYLDRMDYNGMLRDAALDTGLMGETYFCGPVNKPLGTRRWVTANIGQMKLAEDTSNCPWFEVISPLDVYPDSGATKPASIGHYNIRRVFTESDMEMLQASDDPSIIKDELDTLIASGPNWTPAGWWDTDSNGNKYVIWQRLGFLSNRQLKMLAESGVIKVEEGKASSCWDIYYTESGNIIRAAIRKSLPNQIPMVMARTKRSPKRLHGRSLGESINSITEALNDIFRAIDDQTDDLSGVNAIVDPSCVENADYSIRGRKTWIKHRSTIVPEESNYRPVEFLTIPNNLQALIAAMDFLENRLAVVTGLPSFASQPRESMGSGIRTIGQQEQLWEGAEKFIRLVVGNLDEELTEPIIDSLVQIAIQELKIESAIRVQVIATGVQGAIRREIIGRRFINLYTELANSQKLDWINEPRAMALLTEFFGIQDEGVVLTPEEYVSRAQAMIQQKALEAGQMAGATVENQEKHRASSGALDVMLQMFKSLSDPLDPTGPVIQEQIFELAGKANSRLYAALAIKSRAIAAAALQNNTATQEDAANLTAPFANETPEELEPGATPGQQNVMADGSQNPMGAIPEVAPPPPMSPDAMPPGGTIGSPEGMPE